MNRQISGFTALIPVLPVLIVGAAHAELFDIRPGDGNVATFHSKSQLEPFDGNTEEVEGWIELSSSALTDSFAAEVEIDLESLDTGIELRNQHMRANHLETDRFPRAIFRNVRLVGVFPESLTPHEQHTLSVEGELSLHGVTKNILAEIEVTS